jgi:deoxycytidine triphosphate deaminase
MIVGKEIIRLGLVKGGNEENLKNSTYDLTVGEIVPIGKEAIRARIQARGRGEEAPTPHFLEPREMVWVLSNETFAMPGNVTGIATLRTTFTKQGILALNVGIIDPFFQGPISTALINFSDKPRPIMLGDKFFRVAFFEHSDVSDYHTQDENVEHGTYISDLEKVSFSDFAPSFLNIPSFDDKYYEKKLWSILFNGIRKNPKISIPIFVVMGLVYWYYFFDLGFAAFLGAKLVLIGDWLKKIKDVIP